MPLISVTRLRLRSIRFVPALLWHGRLVTREIIRVQGFLTGKLFVDAKLTVWTMTAWNDLTSMRAFRDTGAHKRVMPHLANWCSEATSVHWEQESDHLPDWERAYERLVREGRVIYVKKPSGNQRERRFPEPCMPGRVQRDLRPPPR